MRTILAAAFLLTLPVFAQDQDRRDDRREDRRDIREERLVQTVESDVQHAAHYAHISGKDRERIDNALHHLSDFDAKFARGDFDKGKLDQAIDDVKNVVDNNHLSADDRRILADDLSRLREFRARRGN